MSLSSCEDWDTQVQQLDDSIDGIEALMRDVEGGELGGRLIQVRERVDRFESIFAAGFVHSIGRASMPPMVPST
jgi:hypothetical protein